MIELAVADAPALLCLQELPLFAFTRLRGWSGMDAFTAVAKRTLFPELVGRLTDVHPGLLRSAIEGQGNAILAAPDLRADEHRVLALNPRRFREREARRLDLPWQTQVRWALERRVCQAVRVTLADGRSAIAANFHATAYGRDKRPADAEVLRAAAFADGLARPGEPVILAGDFNVSMRSSANLRALMSDEWGFSPAGSRIDHILVRGLRVVRAAHAWPAERRRVNGALLSDHAPVEIEVE
jgi:endonuclease/exonuclease/phosphatase family metal-dependent hydrolase